MGRKKKTAQRNNQGQGAQGGQANQSMALVLSTESYYHSSDVANRGKKRALNSVIVVPEPVPVPVEPEPTAKLAVDMDKLAEYFESTWGEDTEDFQLCLCHSAAALLQFGSMPPDKLVSRLEADGVWHAREGETPEEQADSLIRNLRKDRGLHFDHFPFEGKAYHGSSDSSDSGGFIVLKPGAFPMELRQQLYYGNGIEEPERWIYPVSPSAAVHRNTHRQGRFHQRLRECIDAIWHTADEDTRVRHAVATYLSKVPWAEAPIEDVQVHLDQEGLWPLTFFPEKRICSGTDRDVGRTLRELLASDNCHFSTVAKGHVNLKISQVLISGYVCRLEAVETAEQLAQLQGLPQQQASLLLQRPQHAAYGADNDGDVYDNGNDEPKQLEYDGFDGCVDDDTDAEEQQYDQRPNTHHVLSYGQGYDRGFEPYPYPYQQQQHLPLALLPADQAPAYWQQQQQQPGGMAPRGWGSGQASGYAAAPMHAFPGFASMPLQAGQGSDPWASSRPPRSMQDTACPAAGSGQMLPEWGEAGIPRNVAYRMTFSPHGKPQYTEWDHSLTRQPHEAVLQQGLDRTEQGAGQRGLHHPMHSFRRHADDEVHHGDDATGVHGEDMGMGMGAHADADTCMDGVEDAAVMELLHALPRGLRQHVERFAQGQPQAPQSASHHEHTTSGSDSEHEGKQSGAEQAGFSGRFTANGDAVAGGRRGGSRLSPIKRQQPARLTEIVIDAGRDVVLHFSHGPPLALAGVRVSLPAALRALWLARQRGMHAQSTSLHADADGDAEQESLHGEDVHGAPMHGQVSRPAWMHGSHGGMTTRRTTAGRGASGTGTFGSDAGYSNGGGGFGNTGMQEYANAVGIGASTSGGFLALPAPPSNLSTLSNTDAIVAELFSRMNNRMGLPGSLARISAVRGVDGVSVIGLTYRVGRHVEGAAEGLQDLVAHMAQSVLRPRGVGASMGDPWVNGAQNASGEGFSLTSGQDALALSDMGVLDGIENTHTMSLFGAAPPSLLLLGPPGVGKTTMLRDICRMLSDRHGLRVVVVDSSAEIAGDSDTPHACLGALTRRIPVPLREQQHTVMNEAVMNHNPQVLVIDEIGSHKEARAAKAIAARGVLLIATAHGNSLSSLLQNSELVDLLGGVQAVTMGDAHARSNHGMKTRLERKGAPAFGMLVEVLAEGSWRVHPRLAESVDVLLGSQLLEHGVRSKPHAQLRQLIHPGASAAQSLLSPLHGLEDDEGSEEEEAGGPPRRRHGRGQRTDGSGGNLLGGGGSGWQGVVVRARFETALAAQRALLA